MAEHPIKRVSNEAVLQVLRDVYGLQFPPGFDMSGAQNSTFFRRVYDHLSASGQPIPKDLQTNAIRSTKDLEQIAQSPDWDAETKFFQTLKAYNIPEDKWKLIHDEARAEQGRMGPSIREGGKPYSDMALTAAAAKILGADSPVLRAATQRSGLTPPPPPPGMPGGPPLAQPTKPVEEFRAGERAAQNKAPVGSTAPPPLAPPAEKKAPGGGTPPGGGGGLPPVPDTRPIWQREGREPTPQEVDDFVNDNFGADAWFMDVPEIKAELTQMARDGITDPEEAKRRISATSWYKNTASSARLWHAKERSDPASAMADVTEQTDFLQSQADQLGVTIDPARLRYIAESSLRFGWSPSQINRAIAAEFRYDPKSKVQATKVVEMKDKAKKFMVPLSDEAIQTWATGLMSGQFNEASYDQYLKDSAKSLFPQLVAAIDSGMTVADYVDPYRQIAAQTLEMNPDTIDFMDPKWRQAFDQKDDKGNRTIMTLSEWSSKIRTDKTYGYDKTQRGVQEASQFATSLLKKFGAIA
jgi:hypothetical protein